MRSDVSAHKKCYDLVHPMLWQIMSNELCPVQQVFALCVQSWLKTPETPMPDVSRIPDSQWELLNWALADQEQIGWHLLMRGYISCHWAQAIAANPRLKEENDKDEIWIRKTIQQLWEFSRMMCEHCNAILHDHQLKASQKIHDAQINDEIMMLYENN